MIRLLACAGLLLALVGPIAAQERMASVQLEDGRRLEGRVLSMNLKHLKIQVGNKILKVPASLIRSCRFAEADDPATQALRESEAEESAANALEKAKNPAAGQGAPAAASPAGAQVPAAKVAAPKASDAEGSDPQGSAPGGSAAKDPVQGHGQGQAATAGQAAASRPAEGQAAGSATDPVEDPAPAPAGESRPGEDAGEADGDEEALDRSRITWTRPIQDPVDPTSIHMVPVDQRRSHLKRRIGMLDRAYPWLAPAAPSQWISLGVMLLVGLSLIVHLSVHVAGGEKSQLGRSTGLAIWYLATGFLQVAMVPVNDLSVVLMILINSTLSLFALVGLFGLTRSGAVVALMVQLGFAMLVFGILELVTALLGTVGATP